MKKIFFVEGRAFIGNEVKVNASGSEQRKYAFYLGSGEITNVITALENRMVNCLENLEDVLTHDKVFDTDMLDNEVRSYIYTGKDGYTHHFSIPAYKATEKAVEILQDIIEGRSQINVHDITSCKTLGWLEADQIVKACMEFINIFNPFWLELLERRIQDLKN